MAIKTAARGSACLLMVVAVGLLAAACGGGKSSSSTSTSSSGSPSAAEWTNDLCGAFSTWSTSLHSAANKVKENPTKDSLKSASDDLRQATDKLRSDLKGLGKPDIQAGTKAKETVDTLSDQMKTGVDTITKAVDDASSGNGVVQAVSTVSSTLVTIGDQVSTAFTNLQQLDAKGEIEKAFNNADVCKSLGKQGS